MGVEPPGFPPLRRASGQGVMPTPRLSEISLSPDVLIIYGRMVTAAFGLLAIWLDPTRPAGEVWTVQIVLAAYLVFSFVLLGIAKHFEGQARPPRWITHTVDISALSVLVLFSEELDSPFFVFFTFTLMTAALQWGMGGILVTALALQILLATSALLDLRGGDPELNILIMRSAYCWVSAVMLGYFATYRERMRHRLANLAAWQPEGDFAASGNGLSRWLDGALEILEAKRVAVLWKDLRSAHGFAIVHAAGIHETVQKISGDAIDGFEDVRGPLVIRPHDPSSEHILALLSRLVPPAHQEKRCFRWRSICVTKLISERHEGVVIVVDGGGERDQLAALANIVTLRIAGHLEQLANAGEQAEAASLREREGLAQDLHDGVLQHLTAAALHLKVARRDPSSQAGRLATVAEILLDQQQQIRQFVEGARASATLTNQPLNIQLRRLSAKLGDHWDCRFDVRVTPQSLRLDSALVSELCLLLSEAAANAVRHGHARHIVWTIGIAEGSLFLTIDDDGSGLSGLECGQIVPRSLSARVATLGGSLEISSRATGVRIGICIGLEEYTS